MRVRPGSSCVRASTDAGVNPLAGANRTVRRWDNSWNPDVSTVTLLDEDDKKVKYQLVGQVEADARDGRISYNSPLGRALIGREKGDEVEVSTPSGDRYYEIAKVEFL